MHYLEREINKGNEIKKNSIKYMYDIKIHLSHSWMQRVPK